MFERVGCDGADLIRRADNGLGQSELADLAAAGLSSLIPGGLVGALRPLPVKSAISRLPVVRSSIVIVRAWWRLVRDD